MEILRNVKPQGLDASKRYMVKEINLMPNAKPTIEADGKIYSGDYLMKVGINVFTATELTSHVVEITAQ